MRSVWTFRHNTEKIHPWATKPDRHVLMHSPLILNSSVSEYFTIDLMIQTVLYKHVIKMLPFAMDTKHIVTCVRCFRLKMWNRKKMSTVCVVFSMIQTLMETAMKKMWCSFKFMILKSSHTVVSFTGRPRLFQLDRVAVALWTFRCLGD